MNLKFLSTQMGTSVAMIDKHYGHVEVSEIGGEIAKKGSSTFEVDFKYIEVGPSGKWRESAVSMVFPW